MVRYIWVTTGYPIWCDGLGWGKVFPGVSRDVELDFDVRFNRRGQQMHHRLGGYV